MPTDLSAIAPKLQGFLLALARVAGVVAFAPFPGWSGTPDQGRIVLAVGMAFLLQSRWPVPQAAFPTLGELVYIAFSEVAFGLSIGLVLAALSEALTFAAQIASLQAGYSYSSIVDPMNHADSGLLPVFYQLVAGLLFFSFGVDRFVLSALGRSFDSIAPAAFEVVPASADAVIHLLGTALATGFRLAIPVACALILADIGLAIAGRVSAQLQLLSLAFPVKMLLAISMLSLCAQPLTVLYGSVFEQVRVVFSALLNGSRISVGS